MTSDKTVSPGEVTIEPERRIAGLPELATFPEAKLYNLGPEGWFDEPVTVCIPLPEGVALDETDLWYLCTTPGYEGWYLADNVEGWIVPESRRVEDVDGVSYLVFEATHSGRFQLGRHFDIKAAGIGPVSVSVGATPTRWALFVVVAMLVSLVLARQMRRYRRIHRAEPQRREEK